MLNDIYIDVPLAHTSIQTVYGLHTGRPLVGGVAQWLGRRWLADFT